MTKSEKLRAAAEFILSRWPLATCGIHCLEAADYVESLEAKLSDFCRAAELDSDPAYAHLIMDARRALAQETPETPHGIR